VDASALSGQGSTGQDPNVVMDLAFYILIGALAGSRLFYVLGNWPEFQDNPIEVIKWKEIYELLETATDRCQDVADVIEALEKILS